jgi:hypothetical protein
MTPDIRVIGLILIVIGSIIFAFYESPARIDPYLRSTNLINSSAICWELIQDVIDLVDFLPRLHECVTSADATKSKELGPNLLALFSLLGIFLIAHHYIRIKDSAIVN